MLAMGFSDDVIAIASQCNEEVQTVLYSASFNQGKFQTLIDSILVDPDIIMVDSSRENNYNVTQLKILADNIEHKLNLCHHILKNEDADFKFSKAIVFANKKDTVNRISGWLQSKGIASAVIHSDVAQEIRNNLLRKFRLGDIKIIIATDVASRGLDITELDLIMNFDVPRNGEDYMHRIGRTGRMFETGRSITLVDSQEWNRMISIENFLEIECVEHKIKSLVAKFTGPENRKSSGKSYGKKRKPAPAKKTKTKIKTRTRDRKNIGKRRKPAEEQHSD
jgi:superfamily II DNA/RNA helicase